MGKYKTVGLKPPHKVPTVNMKTIPYSKLFTNSPFTTYPYVYADKDKTVNHLLPFYCFMVLKYYILSLYLMTDYNY